MTGQNVTECTGGAIDDHRRRRWPTATTRIATRGSTRRRSLELAFLLAEMLNLEMTERQKHAA